MTEPAIAALLAGDLKMNDLCNPDAPHKTLALDVFNGAVGFLNSCYLVSELARAGCVQQAMIVTAEVENNADVDPDHLLGLCEMGSAVLLHESDDGETGFQAFSFDYFQEHDDALRVHVTWNERGRPYLVASRAARWQEIYLDCIEQSVSRFLDQQKVRREEIRVLLPPQISPSFVEATARRLGWDGSHVANVASPVRRPVHLLDPGRHASGARTGNGRARRPGLDRECRGRCASGLRVLPLLTSSISEDLREHWNDGRSVPGRSACLVLSG